MEKLDKVIAGLTECSRIPGRLCEKCPYWECIDYTCLQALRMDAREVIEKLREENRDLRKDIAVLTEDLTGAHEEVHKLAKNLKVARTERDAERAKITRLIGMVHKEWLEKVYPDWYSRLEELDYNYDPVKDGTPWYRAEDVWACIEEIPGDHREFGAHMDEEVGDEA